jgi:hypothetical protein
LDKGKRFNEAIRSKSSRLWRQRQSRFLLFKFDQQKHEEANYDENPCEAVWDEEETVKSKRCIILFCILSFS